MCRTSGRGRRQFSVEKPNTVRYADAAGNGEPHEAGQVLLALGVSVGAGQAAAGRPPSVAVHDARHVDRCDVT